MLVKKKHLDILRKNGQYLQKKSIELFKSVKVGMDIIKIADDFELQFKKDGYIINPISIEINHFATDCPPVNHYNIKEDDIFSYTIHLLRHKRDPIDIPSLKCARSFSMDPKKMYVMFDGLRNAMKAYINACGPDVKLSMPRKAIIKELSSMKPQLKGIMNMFGVNMLDDNKIIPHTKVMHDKLKPLFAGKKMIPGELYYIDLYVTNLPNDDVVHAYTEYPSLFVLPVILKEHRKYYNRITHEMKSKYPRSYRLLTLIKEHFKPGHLFSIRQFKKVYGTKKELRLYDFYVLDQYKLCIAYQAKYVHFGKIMADKEIESLKDSKKDEDKQRIKELQKNDSLVIHQGLSLYITETGVEILTQ